MSAHAASAGHEASASHSASAYHESLLRSPVFLGMVMFIGSEIMLFASFFTAFFFVRFTHTHYPFGDFEIPTDSTAINTAILISSSFTMHWALVSVRYNRRFGLVVGLGVTLFLGLTFLALQMHEYHALGFVPSDGAFPSTFFALTGLHGLHVIGGMIVNGYFLGPGAKMFKTQPERFTNRVEVAGLYWHFVDLVWIFLFPTLYLL